MKIFLITDTHFNHDNCIEWCNRPKDFEWIIISNLASKLTAEDILIHLGDVAWHKESDWHKKITQLPGKKWLVLGNHDKSSYTFYIKQGWDFVGEQFILNYFGEIILFSHKPVKHHPELYTMNICGHFHNSEHHKHEPELVAIKNGFQIILAVEWMNYQPVELVTILKRYRTKLKLADQPIEYKPKGNI